MKTLRFFLSFSLAATAPSMARAGAVAGATEVTQLLNNGILGEQAMTQINILNNQIQTVRNQLEQYALMIRNIQSLPQREWNQVAMTLNNLKSITQMSQGFAYASGNAADLFKQQHPTFGQYQRGEVTKPFPQAYEEWNGQVTESIANTNKTVGAHVAGFDATGDLIQQLKYDSMSADGQKAAIQAGNNFAAVQAEQLLLLRQMQAAQIQQQQAVLAAEKSAEAAKVSSEQKAFGIKKIKVGKEKSF